MSHRIFTDQHGTSWQVWDVRPTTASEILQIRAEFAEGWLAFESETSRRRLMPIPVGWEGWSDRRLGEACASAVEQPPRRRLIE